MTDKALLAQLSQDRALASELLFGHRHPQKTPPFHVEIRDLWRCADEFVAIEAFREAGKTTISEEHLTLEGCFGNWPYGLIIGETYTKACARLEAIANECKSSIKLTKLFGKVLARKPTENRVWFASGAMLEAVGWEQELQSFKYHDMRPWVAYLDDPENLERVRDKDSVDASMRKLFLELIPALDKMHRKVRITQTRRAADCMIVRLSGMADWIYSAFPICNGDPDDPRTKSIWPERYPMQWIREERRKYESAGQLQAFNQSYLLEAEAPETKPFKEDMLVEQDVNPMPWLPKYAIYDPARSTNPENARTGKVVVSRMGSKIIVHESTGEFWKPDELRADIFACNERHEPAEIGVEKNSLDEYLMQPIRAEIMRRGVALPLVALQAPQDRDKDTFIMGLQPFAAARDIVLIGGTSAHAKLTAEFKNFPVGKRDVMNALAYAPRMFAGEPIYDDFGRENVAEAPDPGNGETVYLAFNASANEVVCAAVLKRGRHYYVRTDYSASGATVDAVDRIATDARAHYPLARLSVWAPAEVHDQHLRIALVPALQRAKLNPFRGEHIAVSRGCLAALMRTTVRDRRLFTVDPKAKLAINAFAAGYCYPILKGGGRSTEPKPGISKLIAEGIESMMAMLTRGVDETAPSGAHFARNPQGVEYMTALPRR